MTITIVNFNDGVLPANIGVTQSQIQQVTTNTPAFGTAAFVNTGSIANTIPVLDSSGRLPAVDGSQLFNVLGFGGFRNKFRNAALDIWQRGTSISTSGTYTADGWIVSSTGNSCTVSRVVNTRTNANSLYGLQVSGATGITSVEVTQRIESYFSIPFAGDTVTVQAQIFNNSSASIIPKLGANLANTQDNFSSQTTDFPLTNLQVCPSGVWTQVAYTFNVSANAGTGYQINFLFGSLLAGQTIIVSEFDISLTPGYTVGLCSNPPPPELRPIPAELPFNQRYYQTNGCLYGLTDGTGSGIVVNWVPFVIMRTTPNIIILTSAMYCESLPFAVGHTGSNVTIGSTHSTFALPGYGFDINLTGWSGLTVSIFASLPKGNSLGFSAEL